MRTGYRWRVTIVAALLGSLLVIVAAAQQNDQPEQQDILAAAGFKVTSGAAPGYIEDRACSAGGCHLELCTSFEEMDKAHSFHRPRAERMVEDFDNSSFFHEASQRHYEIIRRGEELRFRRFQLDESGEQINTLELEVDWVHGAATLVRTYLYQTPIGEVYQLPVAWYTKISRWGMAPGFDQKEHKGIQRNVRRECQFCHNAYSNLPAGADAYGLVQIFPHDLPEGIGCQRCHGPGAEHTRLGLLAQQPDSPVTEKQLNDSIVNPIDLPPRLHDDVCNQCHARPSLIVSPLVRFGRGLLSFEPGESLADYMVPVTVTMEGPGPAGRIGAISQPYRTTESRCYQASGGVITCSTCHDSHRRIPAEERAAHYRAACLGCHKTEDCTVDEAEAQAGIAPDDCISCHMPRRPSTVMHFPVTDHLIERRPAPQVPVKPLGPKNPVVVDAQVPYPSGELGDLYRVAAVVEAGGSRAVERLQRLITATQPAQNEPYLILAKGQIQRHMWQGAEANLRALLERDGPHPLVLLWLAIAVGGRGDTDQAVTLLREAAELEPRMAETQFNLGLILLGTGKAEAAAPHLKKAVELRPNMAVAWRHLGRAQTQLERLEEAAASYRRALAVEPAMSDAYLELGRALIQQGKPAEALRFWRHGVRVAARPQPIADALAAAFGEDKVPALE